VETGADCERKAGLGEVLARGRVGSEGGGVGRGVCMVAMLVDFAGLGMGTAKLGGEKVVELILLLAMREGFMITCSLMGVIFSPRAGTYCELFMAADEDVDDEDGGGNSSLGFAFGGHFIDFCGVVELVVGILGEIVAESDVVL
jgi:hypothetical protein